MPRASASWLTASISAWSASSAGHSSLVSGYVLGRAPRSEQELLDTSIDFALGVLPEMLAGDWTRAMQKLHSQKA